jgi:hypothetical protein
VLREIERGVTNDIKFTIIRDRDSKGKIVIKFDTRQLFKYVIHHVDLSEAAKVRSVEIYLTVDGAPLDDKTGHVKIGFKICDKEAIDPITKRLIFNEDSDGPNPQSGKLCIPISMVLAKDNKQTYDKCLQPIFDDVDNIRTFSIPECEWLPFKIPEQQDMKSFQLCLKSGGACKGMNYFCHPCQLHSDNVQLPSQLLYGHCVVPHPTNRYHHCTHDIVYCGLAGENK